MIHHGCSTTTRLRRSREWYGVIQKRILCIIRKLRTAYLYPWLPSMSSRPCLRDNISNRFIEMDKTIKIPPTDLNSLSFTFFDIWMKNRTIQQFLILSFSPNFSFLVLSSSNAAYLPLLFEDVPISR